MKKAEVDKTTKKKGGGKNSIMNGRALFTFNPDLFVDDENAVDEKDMETVEEEKEEEAKVDNDLFANEAVDEDEEVDFD